MELLRHTVTIWGSAKLFKSGCTFYVFTISVWELQFLYILTNIWIILWAIRIRVDLLYFFSLIIIVSFKIGFFLNCFLDNSIRKYNKELYLRYIVGRDFPDEMTFALIPDFVNLGSIVYVVGELGKKECPRQKNSCVQKPCLYEVKGEQVIFELFKEGHCVWNTKNKHEVPDSPYYPKGSHWKVLNRKY